MTADQLVGRWKLVSWLARNGDGEVSYPFGERAEGSLVYTRGGWMSGQLAVSDRDALATNDVVGGDEIERTAAYSSYIAYAGTNEVVGDVVIHRVKMSLFPNWSTPSSGDIWRLTVIKLCCGHSSSTSVVMFS